MEGDLPMRLFTFSALCLFVAAVTASQAHAWGQKSYMPYTYGYYGDPALLPNWKSTAYPDPALLIKPQLMAMTAYPSAFGPIYAEPPECLLGGAACAPAPACLPEKVGGWAPIGGARAWPVAPASYSYSAEPR
jgi:hypothetical protein